MATRKTRRRRLTYAEPNEKEIREAWKACLSMHTTCLDDLEQIVQMDGREPRSDGISETNALWFNEGCRWLARRLIGFTIDQPEAKVQKNVED